MKGQTDPSLRQKKTLICFLSCLLWNGDYWVQSMMNSSSVTRRKVPDGEPSSYFGNNVQEPSAGDHHLIPFHHEEECIAHVIYGIRNDGLHTAELKCTLANNGLSYLIPSVNEEWINEQMVLGELISAETTMTLPSDAMLNQQTHEIHMKEPPKLWNYEIKERERRRKLRRLATTGQKTLLVVRIEATDNSTTPTAAELGNYVFGDDGNDYNFKYQTEACSHNALKINKASDRTGTSTNISNGIVTVSVSIATSAGETAMQNAVTEALNTQFGVTVPSELADHVMYCFPTGATSKLAHGEMGGYLSFYNNEACTYPSAALHEIGHNYNMGHSSNSEFEYGDKSGVMGYVYWYTYQPKMCFNAAKSWQLGWYTSKADSISPSRSTATYSTTLAGVVDYGTTSNKVLLEIQQSTSTTYYYVNYNRATGFNAKTQFGFDQVLVVSKDTSAENNISMSLAALESGQSYTITNFNGNSDETVTISFTSLVNNEANLDIVYAGFSVGPTSTPSGAPSLAPSMSKFPSTVPSIAPSPTPSMSIIPSTDPSSKPSVGPPSIDPSSKPSANPSASPSRVPSVTPSISPSLVPSHSPSLIPSTLPSTSLRPSSQPSKVPTAQPSSRPSDYPTPSPTPRIAVQRSATIAVEIGFHGLDNLEVLCSGIGAFLKQGIANVYGSGTVSAVTCAQMQVGLRNLVGADNIFRGQVFDYEKPVSFTVTTTFDDYRTAPRQYGFESFLEQLMVSDTAQRELPNYIQNAAGGHVFADGVHVRLVFTPSQKQMLILGFGEDAPTPSPNARLEVFQDDKTGNEGAGGSSASGVTRVLQFRQSLIVCTVVGGLMKVLL